MTDISLAWWVIFHAVIVICLLTDLITSRGEGKLTLRRDAIWSSIWISLGLAFGGFVWFEYGIEEGIRYITAYITEEALSIDNLFVFIILFTYFSVPFKKQHKTLFYGIVGAAILRATFIFAGVTLIEKFHWVIYIFGAILIYSSYKLLIGKVEETNPSDNTIVKLAKRFLPISEDFDGDKFLTKIGGRTIFTPLIVVLLVVETTDIMFAFDSVPAVLTITGNFFTAYTSNIMAILGLRALYFVVAHAMKELKYLSKGLAIVLLYLGLKTFAGYFEIEVPILWNMGIVLGTITVFIVLSLIIKDDPEKNKV